MNSKETTILSIAFGTWMAWRVMGSSLIPVGSQEIGIAIIVLFKPWLNFMGWSSLLTINAISHLPSMYRVFLRVNALVSSGLIVDSVQPQTVVLVTIMSFVYSYFIWPYTCERVYRKTGVWRRLKSG